MPDGSASKVPLRASMQGAVPLRHSQSNVKAVTLAPTSFKKKKLNIGKWTRIFKKKEGAMVTVQSR
jgi:hypothetical protein